MALGLVLAVTAMGFAVAMPLAVRSFTDVTSQHQNQVAETNASPQPIVTPDTSEPEEIVLPQSNSEQGSSDVEDLGEDTRKKDRSVKLGAPSKAKGPKHKQDRSPRPDHGAPSRPDRGPKKPKEPKGSAEEKDPKGPKEPKEVKEPKDEPAAPVDPKPEEGKSTGTSGSGSPGKSEQHDDETDESEASEEPAASEDDEEKDKGKGKSAGRLAAPGAQPSPKAAHPKKK